MLEAAIEDFARSRPGVGGGPLAGLAELRRRQGRPARRRRCSTAPGLPSGAALPRADGARPRRRARGRRAAPSGCCGRCPSTAGCRARRRSSCSSARGPRRGDLDGAGGGARPSCASWPSRRAPAPLQACADAPRAVAPRRGDTTGRAAARGRGRRLQRGGAPYEAAQARLELAAAPRARSAARGRRRRASRAAARKRAARARRRRGRAAAARADAARARGAGLLAEGLTNRQLAERLVVSEHTVHRHVTNILRKLDLPSRAAAAALARPLGPIARSGDTAPRARWPVRAKTARGRRGRTRRRRNPDEHRLGARGLPPLRHQA